MPLGAPGSGNATVEPKVALRAMKMHTGPPQEAKEMETDEKMVEGALTGDDEQTHYLIYDTLLKMRSMAQSPVDKMHKSHRIPMQHMEELVATAPSMTRAKLALIDVWAALQTGSRIGLFAARAGQCRRAMKATTRTRQAKTPKEEMSLRERQIWPDPPELATAEAVEAAYEIVNEKYTQNPFRLMTEGLEDQMVDDIRKEAEDK